MSLESLLTGKKTLTDEELISHGVAAMQYVENKILIKKEGWDEAWNDYNGNVDFGEKAPWQSQGHLPKFSQAVRITKNIMKQSLIKADDFFAFKGRNAESKEVENDITCAVKYVLDQNYFKQKHFPTAVFRGLLENLMIFKTWVEPLNEDPIHKDQQYSFPISVVSAYDLFIDPTGRRKFVIHRIKKDLSDFRRLVSRGVYSKESLEYVLEDFKQTEKDIEESIRKGEIESGSPAWRKEVELLEYWGDVDNDEGETVYRNHTFTIVNRKCIARTPIKNPFDHGRAPFIWGPIFPLDGSEYAEGFADHVLGLCRMLNESWNMQLDAGAASSVNAYEVDLNYVNNPSALKTGIYPGKTIQTNGVPPGAQAIREFKLGSLSQENLMMTGALDKEVQNATGVNEFISGIVGSSGATATETRQKSQQSMNFLQAVSEDIEDNVLAPFLAMYYKNILQYNPEILGEKVNMLNIEDLKMHYEVKGLSNMLQQQDDYAKISQVTMMLAKIPQVAPMLDWKSISSMLLRDINKDPKDFFLADKAASPGVGQPSPQDQAAQQQATQLMAVQGGKQ